VPHLSRRVTGGSLTLTALSKILQRRRRLEQPDGGELLRVENRNEWAYWGNLRLPIPPWGD